MHGDTMLFNPRAPSKKLKKKSSAADHHRNDIVTLIIILFTLFTLTVFTLGAHSV